MFYEVVYLNVSIQNSVERESFKRERMMLEAKDWRKNHGGSVFSTDWAEISRSNSIFQNRRKRISPIARKRKISRPDPLDIS